MSAPIPEIEPTEIVQGDTIAWTKDLSDYSASDGWTLTYYLRGPQSLTITASASGSAHSISVSATTTAAYAFGKYKWQAYASKSGARYKVGEGSLEILQNPASIVGFTETRSEARQILDALIATMKQAASRPEQGYSLQAAGRSFTFKTHAELIAAIQFWQSEVKREEDAEKITRGEGTGKNIFVRFN